MRDHNVSGIMIAGTASGVGGIIVATGLMGALSERGLNLHAFKVGLDRFNSSYHTQAKGLLPKMTSPRKEVSR
jgi:cobyrinic acid a,c-diamide synthase